MITLHAYVLRELLKTFGLTLLAMTALFTMGGGLYNVVSREGITAADVFRFIPMLIPIVITLTMPMAALFAATMVYGRLAADNELLACRAAGINVHRLFLPVVLLAIFVAAFTLLFGNYVIPGFIHQIERAARNNIRDLVAQSLQRKGFVHRGGGNEDRYTVTAEDVPHVSDADLREWGFEIDDDLHYLLIKKPTFLQIDQNGELVRFAVAQWGLCIFDVRRTPIELTLLVRDGRDFEIGEGAMVIHQQQIGPMPLQLPPQVRLATASLNDMLRWRRAPWEAPRLGDRLRAFLMALVREQFFAACERQLAGGSELVLSNGEGTLYRVTCADAQRGRSGLVLHDVSVELSRPQDRRPIRYEAQQADLLAAALGDRLLAEIRLLQTSEQDVLEYNPRFSNGSEPRRRSTVSLDGISVPDEFLARREQYSPAAVLDPNVTLVVTDELGEKRLELQERGRVFVRQVVANIHFRLGCTLSVLVTTVMGAALGVVFRGARALSAFALAMIPFFSMMVMMVLGRQLAEDVHAQHIGPFVTWGGMVLVLVADLVILRLGVRR